MRTCGYCGRPGCHFETCPDRLEAYYGVPDDHFEDDDEDDSR